MKKAAFLYNPVSGDRFVPNHLDQMLEQFQSNGVDALAYRLPESGEIDTEFLNHEKIDYVIAAGGDGTIRLVAQTMIEHNINKPYIALGGGTCNNFTTNLDVDSNLIHAIPEIMGGSIQKVDVGCVNNKDYFLSSLAGGVFVQTSFATDAGLKETLGPLAYYIKPLSELKNVKSFPLTIETDKETITENVYLFLLLNGRSVGNFTNFLKQTDIQDGKMEMILIKEGSPVETANLFLKILKKEDITDSNQVVYLKSAYFKISSPEDMVLSIDGEEGPSLPVEVSVVSDVLSVIVP
ncbi:YegS/Rv2252/BmrU family lipid kinase [Filifactor villosus]|uniref:YegS/Rv2252/BmrU family lipid kinase n=1 Tax=Filifactor villosus TaxID=29374 RepID=A0ABV9QLJ1_9FIRM